MIDTDERIVGTKEIVSFEDDIKVWKKLARVLTKKTIKARASCELSYSGDSHSSPRYDKAYKRFRRLIRLSSDRIDVERNNPFSFLQSKIQRIAVCCRCLTFAQHSKRNEVTVPG